MSYGWGSLTIAARRSGSRTVLERVRYDGISRCSRAFEHGDAALVVLSQLGPGVVRGDSVSIEGRVRDNGHLIVTSQTATRLMGGAGASRSCANWTVEDGAVLEIVGEPLVAAANAQHGATTSIDLGAGSLVLITDIAAVPSRAEVRLSTRVQRGGRELFYDAFDAGAVAPQVVGTLAIVGLAQHDIAPVVGALDAAADTIDDARLGIGLLPSGAFARVLGTDIWPVRTALAALRDSASLLCAAAIEKAPRAAVRTPHDVRSRAAIRPVSAFGSPR